MGIEEAIEARKELLDAIRKKVAKINYVASILVRNKIDLDAMKRRYHQLDRAIFMETKGVTKVEVKVRAKRALTTDEMIAALSSEQLDKLSQRLAARIEAKERARTEQSLSKKEE
jgi:hypothetical protein